MNGETKWKAGDLLTHPELGPGVYTPIGLDPQARLEAGGWRLKDQPVKRQLAPGWTECDMMACLGCYGDGLHGVISKFSRRGATGIAGFCEPCAEERGAFRAAAIHVIAEIDAWNAFSPAPPSGTTVVLSTTTSAQLLGVPPVGENFTPAPEPAPDPCERCAHGAHAGPCDGSSPNGEFSCPCGDLTDKDAKLASQGAYAVGSYRSGREPTVHWLRERITMQREDTDSGAHATLLANLARENPTQRKLPKVRDIYRPGSGDE